MATKIIAFIFLIFFCFKSFSNELIEILNKDSNYVELKIVDKITSKITIKKLKIKTINIVKDFEIFIDKCVLDKRKGFLETSALVQIKDKKDKSKDSVFLFNNWMFVSNSTINEIEHPSYDIWLKSCI
tara:strand:+ start:88 stop:471 length:384 start_codon:yes stop_codon:yes gene_type:complete